MATLADVDRAAFEEKIRAEARRFDLKPLLDLLIERGYERDDILFEGTHEGSTSPSIVEAVRFRTDPSAGVVITVNLGLLGDNTLLPSYFFEEIESSPDPERFFDFIRFFDHRLIDNYLRAVYPEADPYVYRDHRRVLRAYLKMLGLGSVSTLEWLWQLYFPELRVRVSRRSFAYETASHAFRTGESLLDGTGILGRIYPWDASGFVVDIFADEETDERGRAWPALIRARMNERVMPILDPFRIPLIVRLKVLYHASWAKVDDPLAEEHGYLGYERIRGDAESGHTTLLYRGVTGERPQD